MPAPSNSIGLFEIGVSPIGSLPLFNYLNTVISQYANSPILMQLLANLNAYFDQTQNLDNFYDAMWNVMTAQGAALDIWGRVVGVNRVIPVTGGTYFDFQESGSLSENGWGQQPFYAGQPLTSNYALSDAAFLKLILAKAYANISSNSLQAINQLLQALFPGRGDCHVTDGRNMTMSYVFNFALTAVEEAIVTSSGVLPRPSGVAVTYVFH